MRFSAVTVERAAAAVILLVYAVLAALYALLTPAWQVPDEPAHYNYIRQVAAEGCCPALTADDWDADYLATLTGSGFAPQHLEKLASVQYEDHQPPLYYLLAAPVYRLTGGSLAALRLFSALIGAGVVLCVYGVARATGAEPPVRLGAMAFAAFLPQHVAILAGVNNDGLAGLIVGAGTLLAVLQASGRLPGRRGVLLLGGMVGLGFLTKASTLLLGPLAALAIYLRWRRGADRRLVGLLAAWAWFLLPALLLGALWWGRNVALYGWPDVMGLGRHDAVVVGQPRTADWIAARGPWGWLAEGVRVTFQSFWGQFGWMGVPMPGWVYAVLLAFTVLSAAGLIPLAIQARRGALTPAARDALVLLAALLALGIAQFIYYNLTFVQFQGRYLYPALSALALAFAGGWAGWTSLLPDRWAGRLRWLPAAMMWGLAGLAALALWRFILPSLPGW